MKTVCKLLPILFWISFATGLAQENLLSVQAGVDRTSLTVGDRLEYTLTLRYSLDIKLDSFDLKGKIGKFEIKDSSATAQTTMNQVIRQFRFTLVPWETGKFEIPAVPIGYKDKAGIPKTAFTDPIKIEVKSVLGQISDSTTVKGLKAQLELGPNNWFYLGLALVALLAGSGIIFYLLNKKKKVAGKPEEYVSPWEKAMQELYALQQSQRSGKVTAREYYFGLSETIRGYLERRFGFPLLESTTLEIVSHLDRNFLLPDSKRSFLYFLQQSDLIKFARLVPETQKLESDWQLAFGIVRETIPRPVVSPSAEEVKV